MNEISIRELAKIGINEIKSYQLIKPDKLIIVLKDGIKYQLNNVDIITKGSHLIVKDDVEMLILKRTSGKNLGWFSTIGLIITLTFSFISTFSFFNGDTTQIKDRIEELDKIQNSLSLIEDYVIDQQTKLRDLDDAISSLEDQKKKIETIISIDKAQLEALLEYQNIQNSKNKWIERIVSFFIGVFSSLMAASLIIYIKNRVNNTSNITIFKPL